MINREAFERARRETDFVAELALGLRDLADEIDRCVDRKDLDGIMNARKALDRTRAKVWAIAERSPPELRDRWRETVTFRLGEFDDIAAQVQNFAAIGDWDSAYGWSEDLSDEVVERALRDMDEALVQRYSELAGTPPSSGVRAQMTMEKERTQDIFKCRYCGAPYAYRENLELHERGCQKRAGYGG